MLNMCKSWFILCSVDWKILVGKRYVLCYVWCKKAAWEKLGLLLKFPHQYRNTTIHSVQKIEFPRLHRNIFLLSNHSLLIPSPTISDGPKANAPCARHPITFVWMSLATGHYVTAEKGSAARQMSALWKHSCWLTWSWQWANHHTIMLPSRKRKALWGEWTGRGRGAWNGSFAPRAVLCQECFKWDPTNSPTHTVAKWIAIT